MGKGPEVVISDRTTFLPNVGNKEYHIRLKPLNGNGVSMAVAIS